MSKELPSDEDAYKIGSRLRLARIGSDVKQPDLAKIINYNKSSTWRIENNIIVEPHAVNRVVQLYEKALNIKPGTIFLDSCEIPTIEPTFNSRIDEILSDANLTSEKREEIEDYILEMTQKTVDFLFPKK